MLPSTSSHEIFSENHAGKSTVMLPKEIHLDQNFHWEMALVELFWPKQDSVAVTENLWYETQGPNRRWKRTYVPSSAFLSMSSVFDYLRKIFKDNIDITYDEYKQMVIWKMKDMNSNLFKVRLSNLLAKCMGFNMSLEFSTLDDSVDEYAKITKGEIMQEYAKEHSIKDIPRRLLIGSYFGKKIGLSTPLLKWYLEHGLVITRIYTVIEYVPSAAFNSFMTQVAEARLDGDRDKDKALIA